MSLSPSRKFTNLLFTPAFAATAFKCFSSRKKSGSRFKYGSLVTAVCTHRYPPPSCHHIKLRKGGSFYTDFGKITHQSVTRLRDGAVVRIGKEPVSCHVLFHETRREDFLDARIGVKAKYSRRFIHPYDLMGLCSLIGIRPGHRALEVGVDFGHLTLLLSDLVGDSGHVISTSKDSVSVEVKSLISDWLGRKDRRGRKEEAAWDENLKNVTLLSFDAADAAAAEREIAAVFAWKRAIDDGADLTTRKMDSEISRTRDEVDRLDEDDEGFNEETDDDDDDDDDSSSSNLLDAVLAVKLPEAATRNVVEASASFLKTGGVVGVVPLDFSHLQSLVDFIHRRRLPFFLEVVRRPETHRCYPSLREAEAVVDAEKGADADVAADSDVEITKEEGSAQSELTRRTGTFSPMGFPKDLSSEKYWPRQRLLWSRRRYEGAWLAKLVRVSDFDFVAAAEVEIPNTIRAPEVEDERKKLEKEIVERFPWTNQMAAEVDELRVKLVEQILQNEGGR